MSPVVEQDPPDAIETGLRDDRSDAMISFFDGVHLNDRIEDSAATRNIACRKRERMLRQQ